VYERDLSAIVLSGNRTSGDELEDDDGDELEALKRKKHPRVFPFGDHGQARVISVKCG